MSSVNFDFSGLAHCADLADDEAAAAVRTRAGARSLLDRMTEIATTVEEACQVVRVLARLPTEDAAGWVDGWLDVELVDGGDVTFIDTTTSLGGGLRERLIPRLTLRVPRDALARALETMETAIEPLCLLHGGSGRIKLVPAATGLLSVRPRQKVAIADDSLVESVPPPAPEEPAAAPKEPEGEDDLDRGWDG